MFASLQQIDKSVKFRFEAIRNSFFEHYASVVSNCINLQLLQNHYEVTQFNRRAGENFILLSPWTVYYLSEQECICLILHEYAHSLQMNPISNFKSTLRAAVAKLTMYLPETILNTNSFVELECRVWADEFEADRFAAGLSAPLLYTKALVKYSLTLDAVSYLTQGRLEEGAIEEIEMRYEISISDYPPSFFYALLSPFQHEWLLNSLLSHKRQYAASSHPTLKSRMRKLLDASGIESILKSVCLEEHSR